MSKITVLGGGGWAIALAMVLDDNGHEVTIWSAVEKEVEDLSVKRENRASLPYITIPGSITVTSNLEQAIDGAEFIVMAVASKYVRVTAQNANEYIKNNQIIIDVAKGVEDETFMTMSEIIEDEVPGATVVALSGPSHAEEVARKMTTAVVLGCSDYEACKKVQKLFANAYFRPYTSPDRKGIEIGGALKNIIALACGMADGMGCGDNTQAAIITRGVKEISALGEEMGGRRQTFLGLSGIGDLIVTCQSTHSRNRRAGTLIAKGYTLNEAKKHVGMVVEGAESATAAKALAKKYGVSTPIIDMVNRILFEGLSVRLAMKELMSREQTDEFTDLDWK